MCHRRPINERWAIDFNNDGMHFSSADIAADAADDVEGYLGVSDRSCVRANRFYGWTEPVAGLCTPVPLPHIPWSKP